MILETHRLILRQFTLEDVDAMLPVLGDAQAMIYYPHAFSRDEVEQFVSKQITRYAETGHGLWAMVLKSTGELIGDCGLALQDVDDRKQIEVGYHLRRDHWHSGYASEAAHASIRYGFYQLHAKQVICMIRPENRPSRRVAERNGMKAGRLVFWHGFNHLIYSISREEWFKAFRSTRDLEKERQEDAEKAARRSF
jgi:RimJ/RimL family protein N-acetyltransferase